MGIIELSSREVFNVTGGSGADVGQYIGVGFGIIIGTASVLRSFAANARLAESIPVGTNNFLQKKINDGVVIKGAINPERLGYSLIIAACAFVGATVGNFIGKNFDGA